MLSVIFLLISLTFSVMGNMSMLDEGIDDRIVGGQPVHISQRPFQAYIQLHLHDNNKQKVTHCGGVIIAKDKILTTAQCFYPRPSYAVVKVGATRLNGIGQTYYATKFFEHPNYQNNPLPNYDVGVLQLHEPLEYGPNVQRILLAASEPRAGTDAIVSGWGHTDEIPYPNSERTLSEHLMAVKMEIVDRQQCEKMVASNHNLTVTEAMICAGGPGSRKGACKGDSGGPLTVGNRLVGIASWTLGCGDTKVPGGYTNIANKSIRDFIIAVMPEIK